MDRGRSLLEDSMDFPLKMEGWIYGDFFYLLHQNVYTT